MCFIFGHKVISEQIKCVNEGYYDEECWIEYTCGRCGKVWGI